MSVKRCSYCKEQKPFAEFNKNKAGVHGLQARCRPCTSQYTQEYKEKRKQEGVKKVVQSKVCARCNIEKPRSQYNKRTVSIDGLNVYCKPCQRVLRNAFRYGKI